MQIERRFWEFEKEYYRGKEFWKPINYWNIPPITDELIKEAEQRLGFTLPSSFLQLLSIQNGGAINFPYFDLDYRLGWMDFLFGIDLNDFEMGIGLLASYNMVKERKLPVPPSKVVILWSDYYHYIGLDYRDTKDTPAVIYIRDTEDRNNPWEVWKVSPTFDEFLSKLYRKPNSYKKINKVRVYKKQINLRFSRKRN